MIRIVHLPQTISAVAQTGQVLLSFVAVAMRFHLKGTARLQLLKYRNPSAGGAVEVAPGIHHATGRDEGLLPRAEAVVGHPAARRVRTPGTVRVFPPGLTIVTVACDALPVSSHGRKLHVKQNQVTRLGSELVAHHDPLPPG